MLKQILPDCTNILPAGVGSAFAYWESFKKRPEDSNNVFIECRAYNDDNTYTVIYRNQTVASILYEALKKSTGSTENIYEIKYQTDIQGNITGGVNGFRLKLSYRGGDDIVFDDLITHITPSFEHILTGTGQPSELLRNAVVNNKRIRIFFLAIGYGADRRKDDYLGDTPFYNDTPLKFRKGIHRP
jgi:hypothetical protein